VTTKSLRPWTELAKLHPDVESGTLTEAVFAIDLGAIAEGDPNVPAVNRDPAAFFRATYLTADLRRLLKEVLASLAGRPGYNRVLKLRTPFGGGKSHTLAALLHAARSREALRASADHWAAVHPHVAEAPPTYGKAETIRLEDLPDPGEVAVAVFDGEKFDARDGKTVPNGPHVRTMWGWLAWQLGREQAYRIVAGHDADRVSPGGDVVRTLLTKGAGGRPVLLLLDEVLKYMERAAAVAVLDSTLQRQAKDFFQTLTVEVAGSRSAAMVYALQWSAREALGNVALLEEIDKLAARVDQLREPVSGDEILPVLQRRLLGAPPEYAIADSVAAAYQEVVTGMQRAYADIPSARRHADEAGLALRERLRAAYPFHPALIDIMRERWTAVESFQRTRGALRFLASCLQSLKKHGGAYPLLGPGEVPLGDVDVRVKLLKELGAQNDYDPVTTSDIEGPNARAKRIDERLARETPALTNVKPATRLATAILLHSFGGLRKEGAGDGELLPPGVTESDLLAACVGPDLDHLTATAVLAELRNTCLYLHYDGVRYCFKKDPNVTKLIEDAEQQVARDPAAVRTYIRDLLDGRLAGKAGAYVWPGKSQDLPHEEPVFLIGYLPLEFAEASAAEQRRLGLEMLAKYGDKPRRFRNGVALAVPDRKAIEALRRAARYLIAIDRVEEKRHQHRLTKDQLDQLKERRATEKAAAESALRGLYPSVWLPRVGDGGLGIEVVEVGGRPLQATGVHERLMELLMHQGAPKVHAKVLPRKIMERLRLGESVAPGEPPRLGVRAAEVREAFFAFLEPPRLDSDAAIRVGIARGVAEGLFGYTSGPVPSLGPDGRYQVATEKVVLGRPIAEDEIDFDSGFLMLPSAVPQAVAPPPGLPGPGPFPPSPPPPPPGPGGPQAPPRTQQVTYRFAATRDQLFKTFPALANLADRADGGKVSIQVEALSEAGFERPWLRNAVEEPLDEANVERS
jgi:predicted AAA+ superfamily ATPase